MRACLIAAWGCACLLACGDADAGSGDADSADTDTTTPDADVRGDVTATGPTGLSDGSGRTARFDDGGLRLYRGDDLMLEIPLAGFVLGTVDAYDAGLNYDPWYLEETVDSGGIYRPPDGLAWHAPSAVDVTVSSDVIEVALSYPGARAATASVSLVSGGVRVRWLPPAGDPPVAYMRLSANVDDTEGFYGLGEFFDHVNHRGLVRPMQQEPADIEEGFTRTHMPIPLLIGTTGWGLFVASYRPGVFNVAAAAADQVRVTYGVGAAARDEGLDVYLFSEDHPLDVTRHYYEATGYPGAVPPWVLGPLYWRDEVDGQVTVMNDLQTLRDLDLAATGYWIDRPYASGVNSFDFAAADYSDPAAMFGAAADLGLRMALWHTPYVDPDDADSRPLFDAATTAGYFPPAAATAVGPWGPPLDFTNADAVSWWHDNLADYLALGVAGFKLDWTEEVVVGGFGLRLPWRFADGSDELTMHRRGQLFYHRTYRQVLPEATGGLLLCRASVWGDQIHGLVIWPGDIDANFLKHGETGTDGDETYVAVGGLPAAVVAGSSLGPSGLPLFGSDTGGYRHSPPSREVFERWFQHTAFSTVMQIGTNSNDLPWSFGPNNIFDQTLVDDFRRYAREHLRLWPYLWTHLQRVADTGRAIQRPLGLAHPEAGVHPDDIYLLGDDLLVAPVIEAGATTREVTLPDGIWRSWWTAATHTGPGTVTVDAPADTIPVFVRTGAPIPMLRPTIDTLEPVADPAAIDSFATDPGPLWVRVALPGLPTQRFVLYDGAIVETQSGTSDAQPDWTTLLRHSAGSVFTGPVVWRVRLTQPSALTFAVSSGVIERATSEAELTSASAAYWSPCAAAAACDVWHVYLPDDSVDVTLSSATGVRYR